MLGQQMHDNFAEAIDEVVVCVMSRADVQRYLLFRCADRRTDFEILGRRVAELERRLSDTVFKTAPERIAATLCQLASQLPKRPLGRGSQIALTHEQIAALTGTSRETATKILDDTPTAASSGSAGASSPSSTPPPSPPRAETHQPPRCAPPGSQELVECTEEDIIGWAASKSSSTLKAEA